MIITKMTLKTDHSASLSKICTLSKRLHYHELHLLPIFVYLNVQYIMNYDQAVKK